MLIVIVTRNQDAKIATWDRDVMAKSRLEHIRRHFNKEADIFDARVVKIVPQYRELLEALVDALPFARSKSISVADLGCGTGTVAWLIKERFPNARITCVDLSRSMLDLASHKLGSMKGIAFELAELGAYDFAGRHDAVVSSLALHHIEPGPRKAALYRRICGALRRGGVFVNADIILSPDKPTQKMYLQKWAEFILRTYSRKDLERSHRMYKKEDRPADLLDELATLRKAGFRHAEVFWKHYNFATYGAKA